MLFAVCVVVVAQTVIEQVDDEEVDVTGGAMGDPPAMLMGKGSHGGNSVFLSADEVPLPRTQVNAYPSYKTRPFQNS